MLSRRFYYGLKPFLPWRMRMALRRVLARRKRRLCSDIWPIDQSAGRAPRGWPGWPEGKRFAVVLTHDIEGPDGLEKVKRLAELEMELGFRSCFNFIPEGPYTVPPDLRSWLTDHGFEVGVHDLHHDGKLYSSRREFSAKAKRINSYLKEWGAAGFRSGFMLHELDWLHDLNIQYDASTFDTDPFEPQTDGAGTIFPFWVEAPSPYPLPLTADRPLRGYVELPYTLPQDSTLFLVLRETTPEIWLQKLDWIAEHGGMALINVHPDCVRLEDDPPSIRTFPVAHYLRFLEHVRQHYDGAFWQVLPKLIAQFVARIQPRAAMRRPMRVCMITRSFYESDNRVTRYAETLVARGDQVDVLALRRSPELPEEETIRGVNLHRIQQRFGKTEKSKLDYLLPSLRLLALSATWVKRRHSRQPFDVLHIHNMPDFLVFAAWYPRLKGAKVILDIHDIVPEFYSSKFDEPSRSAPHVILEWIERRSARFADHIIISNHLWLDKYAVRTGTQGKCSVFINHVDRRTFQPHSRTRNDDKIIILFPGGLQWHQGVDIALRAFRKVSAALPRAEFHIYGDGNMKPTLVALTAELGLNGKVRFFDPVPVRKIAQVMADADLGIVPKRADSFGNEAYSTKIMEFMSLGVPVVVSNTKIDQYYFEDSVVRFFESGNSDSLAEAMLAVLQDGEVRGRLIARGLEYAARNRWEAREGDYLRLVDSLCEAVGPSAKQSGPSRMT